MKRLLCILASSALAGCAAQSANSRGSANRSSEATEQTIDASSISPEQVRLVQRSLADRGFAVHLTGTFDGRTQAALTDFQRARGLPPTGQLDTPTVEALGIDPRDVMPVRGEEEPNTDLDEGHAAGGG
jgi:peptidoglycan hydrolase-like protein with peptidoglycan-binding domain